MVSVLAFNSDDPSSNPPGVYNFSVKNVVKRSKINKNVPRLMRLVTTTFREILCEPRLGHSTEAKMLFRSLNFI